MRLVCPNCDAQYEVPIDIMPPDGRDVQCSNCGQTWFQAHPDAEPQTDEAEAPAQNDDEEVVTVDIAEQPAAHPAQDQDAVADSSDEEPPIEEPEPSEKPAPVRRELDPAVANVLRAEAELEAQARKNEMSTMESQPDLGLDLEEIPSDEVKRTQEARARMARMRGESTEYEDEDPLQTTATDAALGSRRDLLPDIEEINSTLRSNSDRSAATDPGQTAQFEVMEQRSSRRGFTLTVLLVAFLVCVYIFAPRISEAVPALEPALAAYVGMVDGWREWLDTKVSDALSWLDEAAISSNQ